VRILLIAPPWLPVPPTTYGGIEAVLDTLARGLDARGHDVVLYTAGDSTCPVPRAWTYEKTPALDGAAAITELRHVVDAYDLAHDVDLVHDHTLVGPLYCSHHRQPTTVVTTNHGPFTPESTALYRAVGPVVPLIAISHHQASTAGTVPVATVIHHGVDPDRYPIGAGRDGYALFLGRLNPDKGVHTAIHVARAAGMPLRIAAKMSEPAEHAYFRNCVEPLLGGDVEFLGDVGGDAKLALIGGATCLVNPVAWPEPFGMVMIEALACGTPVVATPCGAAPEIVDDGLTGFLRHDVRSLAEAVQHVDGISRSACRRAVEDRFSADRLVDEHVDLFERVVEGRDPGRALASFTVA
jgi:glycosyltransferase involved in cell wall biosynthesis